MSDVSGYWTINIEIGLRRVGSRCVLIAAKFDVFNAFFLILQISEDMLAQWIHFFLLN